MINGGTEDDNIMKILGLMHAYKIELFESMLILFLGEEYEKI
jgi:hypothetical protein